MAEQNLFASEEPKEIKAGGETWKYKPITAGDENDWLDEYLETITETLDDGRQIRRQQVNFSRLNKCKVRNITEVPFTRETIKEKIGVDKEWADLNSEQRWDVLKRLKPSVFDDLIATINEIDKAERGDTKKQA